MNIFGVLIVKNESDIIEQTILSLKVHGSFKKIFIYDNESIDETYSIAKKFEDDVIKVSVLTKPFSDQMKYSLLSQHSDEYKRGDWLVTIDGDELYEESLFEKIIDAENSGANCIEHNTVQFYLTEVDDADNFNAGQPAIEQRKHYLLNYGEPRVFKYDPDFLLSAELVKARHPYLKISANSLVVHHFQYRSIPQLVRRINARIENNKHSNNWGHVKSVNPRDYLVQSRYMNAWNGQLITGLPADANLYKIPNNPAYTMANLVWMKKRGFLTEDQLGFFEASRLKRLVRRFF